MNANQAAFDVGRIAERMAHGYYAHIAAITVATDPRSVGLIPPKVPGQIVPVGYVTRKDGTQHVFHFSHFLQRARNDPATANDLQKIWLAGALLIVGDALSLHDYFDRAPVLELLRHLRNGIAHGNSFRVINSQNLTKHPAHNRLASVRSTNDFEITLALQGQPILFDFMAPGDVLDVLMSVGLHLTKIGIG